ncbi:MAG: type II toxin-antitoxin system Phd/YefM family antitoxin [Leptolyngbyaceae cyanobacterium]
MSTQYTIEQAQTHLDEIMTEVEQGNSVEILKAVKRVAVLVSSQDYDLLTAVKPSFWAAIETFRRDFKVDEEGVADEFWEGLRDQSPGREVNFGELV